MDLLSRCLQPPQAVEYIARAQAPIQAPQQAFVPMDVPKDDHWIFHQISNQSTKPSDLASELTMLRYLRHKMMQSLEAHSAEAKAEFQKRVLEEIWKRIANAPEVTPSVRDSVTTWVNEILEYSINKHFPEWELGPREVKAFQDIIVATGKVAEQYKKIIEGMTININIDDAMVVSVMQEIVMPALPRQVWPQVILALQRFSPTVGAGLLQQL